MITRLYLRSLALGLATAATFWPATHHWLLMGLWCALASVFVVDMIHAVLVMVRLDESLVPKRAGNEPPRPNPRFPPRYTENTNVAGAPPFRFVGINERDKQIVCKCKNCETARAAQ